jgi:electron transfer flavoprotein beta subunit
MKIAVLMKEIVDLIEEINVSDNSLERDDFAFKVNEFDSYALEEAMQLKTDGDTVDVFAIDGDEADQTLYMAAARGANGLFKILIDGYENDRELSTKEVAKAFSKALEGKGYDLILTGIQGVSDLDGLLSGLIGIELDIPSMNVVVKVESAGSKVTVMKEFAGGVQGEYEVELPAVFGIQTSRAPPPYIPVSKVRKASKEATIEEVEVSIDSVVKSEISKYSLPETGEGAQMIEGDLDEQVDKLFSLLKEKGFK